MVYFRQTCHWMISRRGDMTEAPLKGDSRQHASEGRFADVMYWSWFPDTAHANQALPFSPSCLFMQLWGQRPFLLCRAVQPGDKVGWQFQWKASPGVALHLLSSAPTLHRGSDFEIHVLHPRVPSRIEAQSQSLVTDRLVYLFSKSAFFKKNNWEKKGTFLCVCLFFGSTMTHQFSPVAQLCPSLCNPMDHSTQGFPVHHQLPEFTQTHIHLVSDAIQPSHPLSTPSPSAPNPSQHQGLFKWVSSSHQVAKVLEFHLQPQSFQWTPRSDFL